MASETKAGHRRWRGEPPVLTLPPIAARWHHWMMRALARALENSACRALEMLSLVLTVYIRPGEAHSVNASAMLFCPLRPLIALDAIALWPGSSSSIDS